MKPWPGDAFVEPIIYPMQRTLQPMPLHEEDINYTNTEMEQTYKRGIFRIRGFQKA